MTMSFSKKFDPECIYIKRWLPELKDMSTKVIHTWFNKTHGSIKGYSRSMVDHAHESSLAKESYKKAARRDF